MNAADLAAEFANCCLPDRREKDWLHLQGVPPLALLAWPGPVLVGEIETHTIGVFDFAEAGRRAFIQPVLSGPAYSDLIDLVAWCPADPGKWWSQCYSGVPLGVGYLDRAEISGASFVVLRRDPLSWLKSGGTGVVPLDWTMTVNTLRGFRHVICEDAAHGEDVQRRLATPAQRMPEVRVFAREAA